MKSTLQTTAELLILIGAIIATIINAFLLLLNFWWILPIFWFVPVIIFTWVTRHLAITKNSQGWIIFGIILSFFSNWIGLAGYICLLIETIKNEQQQIASNTNQSPFEPNQTEDVKFEDQKK